MSKKYKTTTSLVIVESPAKCKKIEQYLGPGYKCIASYGHIRELKSLTSIDIDNGFNLTYTIIDDAIKKKQVDIIKKEIKNAYEVILATDNDREGESISWHICDLYNLDINKTKRILFNEITEHAIKKAIQTPVIINMNMVNAQKTRQILDLLIGFKISPMLWKFISRKSEKSLSAGRCQTTALKIIYENQQNINKGEERTVYNTTGLFTNANIPFELNKQYDNEDSIANFLNGTKIFSHIYTCTSPIQVIKTQPDPFTTSRLQQVASNELHYSPKETMTMCQSLYEAGYITYMRTDSKTYSNEFIEKIKKYIEKTYTPQYINNDIDCLISSNAKNTTSDDKINILLQEAHEAIRVTDISLYELPENKNNKESRLYKLIWRNTLESCMTTAIYNSVTASICGFNNTKFTYSSEQIIFPGWKIVANKYSPDNKEYQYLQTIPNGTIIHNKKVLSKVTIQGITQHYTEAKLIQLLEEKGIGRPSTFSSIIDKIQHRCYVKKEDVKGKEIVCKDYELDNGEIIKTETSRVFGNEKNKLVIQQLGIIVMEFLDKHFEKLFDYGYTSNMETSLDKISKGELFWRDICSECNNEVEYFLSALKDETKIEIKIDENNTYLIGKYGPIIKCVEEKDGKQEITFKQIKKDIDFHTLETGKYNVSEIVEVVEVKKSEKSQFTLGQYEGKNVILKKGKFGPYITWGEISKPLKDIGNRPLENITLEEVKVYLDEGSNIIRVISSNIAIRKGPKGDYIFYKSPKLKKPQFFDIKKFTNDLQKDYKICDISILKSWINETYGIK